MQSFIFLFFHKENSPRSDDNRRAAGGGAYMVNCLWIQSLRMTSFASREAMTTAEQTEAILIFSNT